MLLPGKRTIFIPVSESESQGKRDSTNKSSLFCMSVDCEGKAYFAEVFIAEVWFLLTDSSFVIGMESMLFKMLISKKLIKNCGVVTLLMFTLSFHISH